MENTSQPKEAILLELEAYSKKAADELRRHIVQVDQERYKNFLYVMYHYTMYSEEKLNAVAELSENDELKEYFAHMAKEERGHYILAREDLAAMGTTVSETLPPSVRDFNEEWAALSRYGSAGYLGAIYVFENIAKYLQKEGMEMMERLQLEKTQSRWVLVHLTADLEHGDEIKEMCEKYADTGASQMLEGAKVMYRLWLGVFTAAFGAPAEIAA